MPTAEPRQVFHPIERIEIRAWPHRHIAVDRLPAVPPMVEIALAAVFVLVLVAGVRWRGRWLPRAVVQVVAVAMLGEPGRERAAYWCPSCQPAA